MIKVRKASTAYSSYIHLDAVEPQDATIYFQFDMVANCDFIKKPKIATEKCVPGYEYLKSLSSDQGGFGAVDLYRNNKTRATVAIKQVSYMNDEKNIYHEVADEINFMLNIKHPNIATYHDYFIIDKRNELYIVKEYAKRGSLRHMLTDQIVKWEYFSQNTVLQIIRDVMCGVHYLNSLKVVLCDLKPENIMVGDDGYMKICDFGTAHDVNGRAPPAGARSFSYMAPELFDGMRPDEKALVWSLGIILYELCTLQHPFQPFATADELLPKLKANHFNSLNLHENAYSYDMQEFVEWMLQTNRVNRKSLSNLLKHSFFRIKSSVSYFVWL